MLAEATRDSEIIRGQGDGCRNRVFANVFGQDPDFFAFYRSMQAYEKALEEDGTTMVLSPDSAFFQFLNDPNSALKNAKRGAVERGKRVDLNKLTANGQSLSDALCPEIELREAADEQGFGRWRQSVPIKPDLPSVPIGWCGEGKPMLTKLLLGIGLVLVIEGSLYALFPSFLRRMMQQLETISDAQLRFGGLLALVAGVGLVWIIM